MKTYFQNLKIRYKIFIPTSIFITSLTIILAVLIAKIEKNTILEEAQERSLGLCEILGYASVKSLFMGDLLELQGLVETIYRRNEVKEVVIIKTDGKILVSSEPDNINKNWDKFDFSYHRNYISQIKPYFVINDELKEITTVVPILSLEDVLGYASVTLSLVLAFERINKTQHIILISGLSILISSLILLYFLSTQITKPIHDLRNLATEYGKGNLELRTQYEGKDEAGELAREFNQMASNILNLENELIHQEKLAALGTTASAIAHELKTPLTSLTNFIQKFPEKKHDEEFLNTFQEIFLIESDRLNKLVNDLLTFSRKETLQKQEFPLYDLINNVLTLLRDRIDAKGIDVKTEIKLKNDINADYQKIYRVFVNLLENAISAINIHGLITIKAFPSSLDEREIQIEISDNGCGIGPEVQEKIFEPFFTTKSKGTGLGLAICKNIITLHSGTIEIKSQENFGTTFIITIPTM